MSSSFPAKPVSRIRSEYSLGSYPAIFVLLIVFSLLSVFLPHFFSVTNLYNLFRQLAMTLVVAAGVTIVMISGEFDISVGSTVALSAITCALGISRFGVLVGVFGGLSVGLLVGSINGLFVAFLSTPSLVTTLSTMMIVRSLSFVTSQARVLPVTVSGFRALSHAEPLGVPILFLHVAAVYAATQWILKKTRYGRYVYAVGSNEEAARLCGIRTSKVKFRAFLISGLFAGVSGVLLLSRIMAVQADAARNLELEVLAGVIVGGTALSGGRGNALMTIVGVLIIGIIRNAINLSQIDMFWNDSISGAIILISMLANVGWRRLRNPGHPTRESH